jgi:hypothetical protein
MIHFAAVRTKLNGRLASELCPVHPSVKLFVCWCVLGAM